MRIVGGKVYPIIMPFEDKDWKFALGAMSQSEGFLLKLETDEGIIGWGYTAAAGHIGETKGSVQWALEQMFLPYLINKDPLNIESIIAGLNRLLLHNPRAKTCVDLALHDLVGKRFGLPVYSFLGGKVRETVEIIRLVPLKEPEEQAIVSKKLVGEGYRYLKLKISGEKEKDVARVKAVRDAVGPRIVLTVDANQSYDPWTAIQAIRAMEKYDIYLVEQPVRYDDFAGLSQVTHHVDVLVDADESARTLGDIVNLIRAQAVSSISLKVPKLGGILNTKKAAAICAAAGMRCRIGDAFGGRLYGSANMHVIASTPNLGSAAEAAEFLQLKGDPVVGLEVVNGTLSVPEKPGLGVEVRGIE
jgi:L-alanine-DL-glutamate epimerase-like enolase superfamily enzyme